MSVIDDVRDLVTPLLTALGLELFDVEFTGGRLVVLADRPEREHPVDLDVLTAATRSISAELDRADIVPGGRYLLEVSSPGLERRLRTPAHFRRFLGAELSVKTVAGTEGERRVKGVLEAADDTGITVASRRLEYAAIERAQTVFEWGGQPKPGKAASDSPKKQRAKGQHKEHA